MDFKMCSKCPSGAIVKQPEAKDLNFQAIRSDFNLNNKFKCQVCEVYWSRAECNKLSWIMKQLKHKCKQSLFMHFSPIFSLYQNQTSLHDCICIAMPPALSRSGMILLFWSFRFFFTKTCYPGSQPRVAIFNCCQTRTFFNFLYLLCFQKRLPPALLVHISVIIIFSLTGIFIT